MQTQERSTRIQQKLVNSIIHGFGIIFGIISLQRDLLKCHIEYGKNFQT